MISRDLKLYFFLVCIPAVLLTGVGLVQLHKIAEGRRAASVVAREGVIERIQTELREAFFDEEKPEEASSPEARRKALLEALAKTPGVAQPEGAFTWRVKGTEVDVRSSPTVPTEVLNAIARLRTMGEWGTVPKNRKKPPMAGVRLFDDHPVVWVRDGKRNGCVCGVVFADDPVVPDILARALWPVGLALGVLLAGILSAGTILLVRAAAKARRDDRMKTTFLSNASHELKTPLAGIGLWTDLLKNGRLAPDRAAHAYDIISAENARMVRLVENLLDFSRLEQGRRRYVYRDLDLAALAADTVDLVRGDFAAHGLTLTCAEAVVARADADATKQILVNLLGNAAKYAAADGPVEVAVSRDDACVRVAVLDRGPGLSAEARAHVFERFWRAETALTAETGGLGLGLSISQALAQDMDGRLTVAARAGGGCVFTLELPSAENFNQRKQESGK